MYRVLEWRPCVRENVAGVMRMIPELALTVSNCDRLLLPPRRLLLDDHACVVDPAQIDGGPKLQR
jgi:hypothetical protein